MEITQFITKQSDGLPRLPFLSICLFYRLVFHQWDPTGFNYSRNMIHRCHHDSKKGSRVISNDHPSCFNSLWPGDDIKNGIFKLYHHWFREWLGADISTKSLPEPMLIYHQLDHSTVKIQNLNILQINFLLFFLAILSINLWVKTKWLQQSMANKWHIKPLYHFEKQKFSIFNINSWYALGLCPLSLSSLHRLFLLNPLRLNAIYMHHSVLLCLSSLHMLFLLNPSRLNAIYMHHSMIHHWFR